MSSNSLFERPRYFKDVTFSRHSARSISWLELFYDLVYVATLIQIGNFLSSNVSNTGFGQFIVLITVIWWAWTGETFYQNRYVSDDLFHRVIVFLQIFAIASLGLSVSKAFGDLYIQFTLAYVIVRILLVFMYLRSARVHPESRELSLGYARGFGLGVLVWLGSLLLPAEIHWVGWLVGVAIELGVPLIPRMLHLQLKYTFDEHHIVERFGIFVIIVLGEGFVKTLDEAQGLTMTSMAILFSVGGLIVTYSLWWLYFADTADAMIDTSSARKVVIWLYAHLPLVAGLVTFGVASKKLFVAAAEHPNEPLDPEYRALYTVAILLYLVGLALIDSGTRNYDARGILIHLISAGFVLAIGIFATTVDSIGFVWLIAIVMLTQVIYSIITTSRTKKSEDEHVHEHTSAS